MFFQYYLLNENNICFFDISPKKIIFLENYKEKPVLSNFKFSLQLNRVDYTYISHILNKLEDLTYQPFEIHILFYFVTHHMVTFSNDFIQEFCENFVENLNILRLFSENYKNTYKAECIETMRKYIKKILFYERVEYSEDIYE